LFFIWARQTAAFRTKLLFPTPPFPLVTVMTRVGAFVRRDARFGADLPEVENGPVGLLVIRNPQSTVPELLIVYRKDSKDTKDSKEFLVNNPQSAIRNPQSPILNPQSPIPNPQSAIPNPQSPIRNPQSAIPNPQSPIRNPQSAGASSDVNNARQSHSRDAASRSSGTLCPIVK
jgi:hypothetical protein